jgi:Protein of unknown function (DUF1761)
MQLSRTSERVSYTAVIVAASIHWVLGAIWFTVFSAPWLEGIGKTRAALMQRQNPTLVYLVAFASNLALAWILAWLIAATGRATAARGVKLAALLWLGLVCTTIGTEQAFEGRSFRAFAIEAGYPLAGILIMGAILGRWRKASSREPGLPEETGTG